MPGFHSSSRIAPHATRVGMAAGLLAAAALAAYASSWRAPFVFDDVPSIVDNPGIRHWWPLTRVLAPDQSGGITTSGRPLVNLSLALNHAIGGERVWSYHAINLAIHVAAGLCLFGLVRRTLLTARLQARFGAAALPLAVTVAAVWLVHPLQTESVTYVIQRAESLVGLFYLITLYGFVRAVAPATGEEYRAGNQRDADHAGTLENVDGSPLRRGWLVVAVVACFAGMATKEVMVSAPLLVLLYDRTFIAGTFGAAWRARWKVYIALAASWLLLGALVLSTGSRGGTAGFSTAISAWTYALTQCRAIVRYLALSVWPHPLVFDYGVATATHLPDVLPHAVLLLALLAGTIWAVARRPAAGFCGIWFFAILAPSSSFVPVVTQTMAEHRMYLPLAAIVSLAVVGGYAWWGTRQRTGWAAVIVALGSLTAARNHDYRSEAAIWTDTVAKRPGNARAHNNLGQALFKLDRVDGAMASYRRALALQPDYPETHYNLGVALARRGELPAALEHYETALRLQPAYPEVHNNLANALVQVGRMKEALAHYEEALRLRPEFAEAHNNLGNALLQAGRNQEAVQRFERALQLKPDYPEAWYNLGNAFAAANQMPRALEQYRRALELQPGYAEAHVNAGNALLELGRPAEAIAHYARAVALNPALVDAHYNWGSVLLQSGQWTEAMAKFEAVLRLRPGAANAHRALGFALARVGRPAEAVPHYEAYLRANPGDAEAKAELAEARGAGVR